VTSASLKDKLVEIVSSYWKRLGTACLLSALGPILVRAGYNYRIILGEKKLSDFIRFECADALRIIPHPADPKVLAVIPKDVEVSAENTEYLFSRRSEVPKFTRGAWSAFLVELKPKMKRFLNTQPPFEFTDIPEYGALPPDNYVEVDRTYIRPSFEAYVPPAKTQEKLEEWAANKRIDLNIFKTERLTKSEAIFAGETTRHSSRAIDVLLSSLSNDELARISLPLDIVKKLLEPWKGS
jgi:hypothetical protein